MSITTLLLFLQNYQFWPEKVICFVGPNGIELVLLKTNFVDTKTDCLWWSDI